MPALTPARVARFQYNPYKNGAMNAPAIAPHETDIRVTMTSNLYLAMKNDIAMNMPLRNLIIKREFSFETLGFTWPLYRSIAIADADTRTRDDRVDMEADKTRRRIMIIS